MTPRRRGPISSINYAALAPSHINRNDTLQYMSSSKTITTPSKGRRIFVLHPYRGHPGLTFVSHQGLIFIIQPGLAFVLHLDLIFRGHPGLTFVWQPGQNYWGYRGLTFILHPDPTFVLHAGVLHPDFEGHPLSCCTWV